MVSIHAPRCRGAKRGITNAGSSGCTFQSTPPVAGERSRSPPTTAAPVPSFNPRPPLPGSEARRMTARTFHYLVSIHAPRCRGAKRPECLDRSDTDEVSIHAPRCRGAKQRRYHNVSTGRRVSIHAPRCRGAKPNDDPPIVSEFWVSIHAPRCRGAKPVPAGRGRTLRPVSIHAPRCRGAKRSLSRRKRFGKPFQSTPPVAGERSLFARSKLPAPVCFNPRPPLPGSEADHCRPQFRSIRVSIHAPRCRGAKPGLRQRGRCRRRVSIHAPRCRGAKLARLPACRMIATFQSTPPVAGERS